MTERPADLTVPTLGVDTRAWVAGPPGGEPLILVHGFRGDHHGLWGMAERIAHARPSARVIVPDLPGFGETPALPDRPHELSAFAEWLRAFAAAAAPQGHQILGHSFGSLVVAQALASGLPASRVVLVNPIAAPALRGPQAALTRLALAYYRAADALPERASRALLGSRVIVRAMSEVMAKTDDRQLRGWIHDQHDRYFSRFADTASLLQSFAASTSHTVTEVADRIAQPTLLIAGDRDDITPLTAQLTLRNRLPDAQLVVIPGVGHLVHYEAVRESADAIATFLDPARGAPA